MYVWSLLLVWPRITFRRGPLALNCLQDCLIYGALCELLTDRASAGHVHPLFETWSKVHIWTCATIHFSANDCNRWSLKADFGLKFFSLQIKHANCLLLIRCCKFAPTPSVGFWTMMYLQWCTFNLNLWSPQFAVLLTCRRYPEKPVWRHLEACPGFLCLSLVSA